MNSSIGPAKRPSLGALTGLRFLAALQVVLFHSMGPRLDRMPVGVANVIGAGYTGVSLFFVLSGFVLAYNYLSPGVRGLRQTRTFLAARVARVYPVYLLGVVLALPGLALRLLHTHGASGAVLAGSPVVLSALTLTQSWIPEFACQVNCPGWSLSVEAFFYLSFPLLAVVLTPRSKAGLVPIMMSCWALSLTMGLAYLRFAPDGLVGTTPLSNGFWLSVLKYNPLIRLPEFVIGMSLGLVFLRDPAVLGRRSPLITLAAIGISLAVLVDSGRVPYPIMNNGLLLGPFAILILALAAGKGLVARFLGSPPMLLLGEASYALYILHVPIHSMLRRLVPATGLLAPESTGFLIGYLIVVVLVAILVLKRLEEPARLVLRRRLVSLSLEGPVDILTRGNPLPGRDPVVAPCERQEVAGGNDVPVVAEPVVPVGEHAQTQVEVLGHAGHPDGHRHRVVVDVVVPGLPGSVRLR